MTQLQTVVANSGGVNQINENMRALSPSGLYGIDPDTTTGLTLGFYGGAFNGLNVANGTVNLTASNTNYVVAHKATGVVTSATNTTNWLNTSTYLQLYQLVAGGSTFTIAATSDKRQAIGGSGGGAAGNVAYDNSASGLTAADVQAAIDEIVAAMGAATKYTRGATWSGGGAAIVAPAEDVSIVCHTAGTITAATILTDGGTGSCVVDVWKDTFANYPPVVGDSITASAKPTVSASIKSRDTTLTGWTKTIAAGDVLRFHLDSTSTFTNIHIELEITP